MKKIVQISFSMKTGLKMEELKSKLINLKSKLIEEFGEDGYELRSCHLSRKLCIEHGLDTAVPDMFEEIYGDKYVCELTEDTYASAIADINTHRTILSVKADKLVILSNDSIGNVALELQLFTNNKVAII